MSNHEATRRFQFIREIASGGFGSVYLAKVIHPDGFSRLAAIKLLHRHWSEDEEITKRMRDEARLLAWLRHKHIVDVIDLTLIDGRCAVVMEYLEAVDTKVVVGALAEQGHLLPLKVALEICAAVASALDAAYSRPPYPGERPLHVIHRDIKPSNVMVDGSGLVKVLDFGVARAEFDAREAQTQELSFGSLEYMPPERLFFEPESPASDVYSLGATLYELLALEKLGKAKLRPAEQQRFVEQRFEDLLERHPFPGEQIEDVLHDLLVDMLAFDEVDRPSAGDCVTRMRSFARRLSSEGLDEWAERTIPPLVRRSSGASEPSREGAALLDRVITEDTAGFANRIAPSGSAPPRGPVDLVDVVTDDEEDDPTTVRVVLGRGAVSSLEPEPIDEVAPPVAPEPASAPDPVAPAARSGGGRLVLGALAALAALAVLGGGALVLVGVGLSTWTLLGDEVEAVAVEPEAPPEAAEPPAPAEGARFVSRLDNTRKMTVRCDGGEASGAAEVVVAGDELGSCTVTAIDARRNRRTAVVPGVEAREYVCFAADENACE